MRTHFFLAAMCIIPSAVLAASSVDVGGTQYEVEIQSCTRGEGYYLIDAKGDGVSLSIVTDKSYTAFDIFYASGGDDLRAGASVDPVPLQDGAFVHSGEVSISNGTKAKVNIALDPCP